MRPQNVLALILVAVLLVTRPLRAEAVLVVLLRPPAPSALVSEALTRIRGELVADGFEVSVVDAPPGVDPAWVHSRAGQPAGASATVALLVRADARTAEVWVFDRLTNKTVVRTIDLTSSPDGPAPELLARRSVELLRASLLEVLVDERESDERSATPRAEASRWAKQALEPEPSRFGVEAGAQVLTSFGGVGSALMPVARVRFDFVRRLSVRLTVSGLGTRPRIESPQGYAAVRQELGLLEVLFELTPRSTLTPSVSLGTGAYHVGVDGSATWPYEGESGDAWSFAGDAGAGIALALSRSFALSLEAHAVVVTPYPVIRFLEVSTAEIDNPLVSTALTLRGSL